MSVTTMTEPSPELAELRATLAERASEIEAVEFLRRTWKDLNCRAFGGTLKSEPAFILSDFGGDLKLMGRFIQGDDKHLILVHEGFFYSGGTVSEENRMICAGLIVLHEMIHQRLRERACRDFDSHGLSFAKEANRLSKIMGLTEHVSVDGNCRTRYWPFDVEVGMAEVVDQILNEYQASRAV